MIYSITEEKRKKIMRTAANDLAKKMRLEPPLSHKMTSFLRKIGKQAQQYFIETNCVLSVNNSRSELTKILFNHYMKVYKVFKNNGRNTDKILKRYLTNLEAKADDADINKKIDESIEKQAIEYSANRADKQSRIIMDTTQRQLDEAYFVAQTGGIEIGSAAGSERIAREATEAYTKKSRSRASSIATTETQAAAENTKFIENNTVAYRIGLEPSGEIEVAPAESYNPLEELEEEEEEALRGHNVKYWVTMADNLVRDAHQDAEGQVQFFDEPFIVMGEQLMIPGDDSLGASDANICNCRCTAVYETIE